MIADSMIASNDDYGGERFSKVNVAITKDTTYYIKVRHYKNGKLLSQINVRKDIPSETLTVNSYKDVATNYGEYALYQFTLEISGTYAFEVSGYNGGSLNYNTYIKLYENDTMTTQKLPQVCKPSMHIICNSAAFL